MQESGEGKSHEAEHNKKIIRMFSLRITIVKIICMTSGELAWRTSAIELHVKWDFNKRFDF